MVVTKDAEVHSLIEEHQEWKLWLWGLEVFLPEVILCCSSHLQGVVGGVMIVTPNNIMFDPHKSDPLVIENGCEEYGLICPMEEVVSIALYNDISHMKIKDALPS